MNGRAWADPLSAATGATVTAALPVSGGDVADSFRVSLSDGADLFLKAYPQTGPTAPGVSPVAEAEALGLAWLAEPDTIRVARPVAHADEWLALEWIESAPPAPDYDEQLGRGLALLHAASPGAFGLSSMNWIAGLPQPNSPHADWPTFYAEERLRPFVRRARDAGALPDSLCARVDRLIEILPERTGAEEPAARLHGDLWSGNVLTDEAGGPCLIDPAVYGGAREVDLAMMRLFGGFSARCFDAYQETFPLAPGASERVALYQVYPLLVHVCLFGRTYVSSLSRAVEQALG